MEGPQGGAGGSNLEFILTLEQRKQKKQFQHFWYNDRTNFEQV